MDDETYCIGVALAAMLLSMLGLVMVSVVGPLVYKKIKDFKLRKPILEVQEPVLKAELSLIESTETTTYYQLLCPVYIKEEDVNQWIANNKPTSIDLNFEAVPPKTLESFEKTIDDSKIRSTFKPLINPRTVLVEKESKPVTEHLEPTVIVKEEPKARETKPKKKRIPKSKTNTRKRSVSKHRTRKQNKKTRKPKKIVSSASESESSSSSSSSEEELETPKAVRSKPKPRKRIPKSKPKTKKRTISKPRTRKQNKKTRKPKVIVPSAFDSESSSSSSSSPEDSKVVLKEDLHKSNSKGGARDVETKLVIEKDPKDQNKYDIEYDLTIDPDTKHPMTVHTQAEVDKDKMDVIGTAEAEGSGFADVEGMIRRDGKEDKDDFMLDVKEKSKDKKEMSLHATLKRKQDTMNKKKL